MIFDDSQDDLAKTVKYLVSKGYLEKDIAKMTGISAKQVREIIANLPKLRGPKK